MSFGEYEDDEEKKLEPLLAPEEEEPPRSWNCIFYVFFVTILLVSAGVLIQLPQHFDRQVEDCLYHGRYTGSGEDNWFTAFTYTGEPDQHACLLQMMHHFQIVVFCGIFTPLTLFCWVLVGVHLIGASKCVEGSFDGMLVLSRPRWAMFL